MTSDQPNHATSQHLCELRLTGARPVSFWLTVDQQVDDPIARAIQSQTWHPSDAFRWLLGSLKPGDKVLDLGAHIGTFALPAAMLGAEVVAVEASPRNVALLRASVDANSLQDRIRVIPAAVSARGGLVDFVDAGPYGTIATSGTGPATGWPTVSSETIGIDATDPGPVTWMKMDIEGGECEALATGQRTLDEVRGLVIESNAWMLREHGASPRSLMHRIQESGLALFRPEGLTLRPVGLEEFQAHTTVDYIATRQPVPMPRGWSMGKRRRTSETVRILVQELRHPVPQHRANALAIIRESPLVIRLHPSVRQAVRALGKDTDPHVTGVRDQRPLPRGRTT